MGLSEAEIASYLRENIHYTLDAECRKGLALYFQLAAECGVIEQAPELEFLGRKAMRRQARERSARLVNLPAVFAASITAVRCKLLTVASTARNACRVEAAL